MSRPKYGAAAFALLFLAAQPCAAADDLRDSNPIQRRTAPFAGIGLSLPLSGPARAKPSARLQFTAARPAGGTFGRGGAAPGIELGLAKTGKPAFYIGGRPTADLGRRLDLGGSKGTILIVVGAIVVLVLIAAAVADAQPTAGPPDGAFD
ncbi:MAG TPA: hypothetical protein VF782_06390 [Allosphingosinicella sp.]|jgi:hypothetical protein